MVTLRFDSPAPAAPPELVSQLQAECERLARTRTARRWAPRLLHVFGIPAHERGLVTWLTDTQCATNEEALAAWVASELEDTALRPWLDVSVPPTELYQRLSRLLNRVTEASP